MITEEEKQQAKMAGLEPEVVFNTLSDRVVCAVMTEDTHETIMEISGYDLQFKFNRDKLKNIADVESLLDGIKDLFRQIVMKIYWKVILKKQTYKVLAAYSYIKTKPS